MVCHFYPVGLKRPQYRNGCSTARVTEFSLCYIKKFQRISGENELYENCGTKSWQIKNSSAFFTQNAEL